jgi:hypothetical protein
MSQSISPQHPAVVLRSHYVQLRALLAVAMIAVVGLTVAVVILATDDVPVSGTSSARPLEAINYGGFNPATGRPDAAPLPQRDPALLRRYDGGPEEGTRGLASRDSTRSAGIRYDGGPEEGSRGIRHAGAATSPPAGVRYDGGPEEGTTGLGH